MGKLSLGLGLAVGYVLGARAGKEKYEQIKQAASGVMARPEVQQAVGQAVEQARAVAPAQLRGTIDKLAASATGGSGSGGAGSGGSGSGGSGSGGTGTDAAGRTPAGTIEGEATLLGDVEAVVPPPPATTGTGTTTVTTTGTTTVTGGPVTDDVPVPDPLVPPAKSNRGSAGRA
ncbi:hypothetical protein SAMN05660359_00937 [Geodermatophilus obscurus]|uniref:Protoporphyrinogen oxidase n=1 Tax=Geodermatophilus obscurus TaxID=1861 RepID=A0A1I5DPL4_9ACTN|nr:hypothetical protein [Geodermatophilus obscurus]SFO01087.1 hypothetical protein SAMN05660359_00937 [Geodermatophilus obscurus]